MNANLWKLGLNAGCLLAAGLAATATPLQRNDVAADSIWVAHLDVDALRPTSLGQFIQGEMNKPEAQAKLAAFQAMIGVDLQKQIHGCTVYGSGANPEDGVMVVYADFDADRLVTLAKGARDYQSETNKSRVIHHWIDENKQAKNGVTPRTYAAIAGARVIFGQRLARVANALDVLDGVSPNLGKSKSFPRLGTAAGFIHAAAHKLELPESDPNAAIFRLSKSISVDIAEAQQQVKATVNLEANDDEIAEHIASIAQGLVALGKLQTEKPEIGKLAKAVAIKQDGAVITINLSLPASDAVELIKADAARKAAKNSEREKP